MLAINQRLSESKPYNAWECLICGTITPVKKGLPAPECEYCRRVEENSSKDKDSLDVKKEG